MATVKDPSDRRRADGDTQLRRDAEIAALREASVPFRVIAARLGISLGSVQKALRRHQRRQAELPEEPEEQEQSWQLSAAQAAALEREAALADLHQDPGDELARFRLAHVRSH